MEARELVIIMFIAATTLLSGCANTGHQPKSPSSNAYSNTPYGVINGIESVSTNICGSGVGAGTIISGVVGGGTGKDIATAASEVEGAVIGHELDKRNQQQIDSYNIRVRFDDGSYQTINVKSVKGLRIGDPVVVDGAVIGHELVKRNQQKIGSYNIRVRFDNGSYQTINVKSVKDLRIGDPVRIDNNQISRL